VVWAICQEALTLTNGSTALAELIRTREVSPVEVMKAHLERIEAVNLKVNAIVTIAEDSSVRTWFPQSGVLRNFVDRSLNLPKTRLFRQFGLTSPDSRLFGH
jgi:hypothetical protein